MLEGITDQLLRVIRPCLLYDPGHRLIRILLGRGSFSSGSSSTLDSFRNKVRVSTYYGAILEETE